MKTGKPSPCVAPAYKAKPLFYLYCWLFFLSTAHFTYSRSPVLTIQALDLSDPLFKQYTQEVSDNYAAIAREEDVHVNLYTYRAQTNDDLLSLAARCNIPYETIALANKLAFLDSPIANTLLYLCTCPGLFIPEKPLTPLEFILKTRYPDTKGYFVCTVNGERYVFVPEQKLNPTERFFFVDSAMTPPLEKGVISSAFGMRVHPFTGKQSFHKGVDIAAPEGAAVYACKSGITLVTGTNDLYGNYIILQHDNNTQSLYAHLHTVATEKGETVTRGTQIGTVGNTGMSTGAHLHFEIQSGGKAQDPSAVVKKFLR